MPQPTFVVSSLRANATFGGMALPNGQGIQASINLNDGVNTRLRNFNIDESNKQISLAQLLYIGRGVTLSRDFGPRGISLPMQYMEDSAHSLGAFLASLSQAGEQQLSFDGGLTYILAEYNSISGRKRYRLRPPVGWEFALELVARNPWFQNAAATTLTPVQMAFDAGTNFNVTYAGSIWAEPAWTIHNPGSAWAINSIQIKNNMSGEFLTINFLSATALPVSTVRDVVIDCAAMTAICTQTGESYDVSGSFPKLYGPPGTVNAMTTICSGSDGNITITESHYPRWQI